jgi:catechol 2,3-dioxygenase
MKIGHVHLKISDMEQSAAFYRKYLGMKITERLEDTLVFMSAGEMHHELALQAVGKSVATPNRQDVGLYHVAFEVPDRRALIRTYQRLKADGVAVYPIDHRISWALYFSDPDGNGIEVYWDTRGTEHGVDIWEGIDRPLSENQLRNCSHRGGPEPE